VAQINTPLSNVDYISDLEGHACNPVHKQTPASSIVCEERIGLLHLHKAAESDLDYGHRMCKVQELGIVHIGTFPGM
jgi:hypothetical protein